MSRCHVFLQNAIGQIKGSFFVEPEAGQILTEFQSRLAKLSAVMYTRNMKSDFPYEVLVPGNIANSEYTAMKKL